MRLRFFRLTRDIFNSFLRNKNLLTMHNAFFTLFIFDLLTFLKVKEKEISNMRIESDLQ